MNKENHMSPDGTSPVTQKRVAIYTRTACDAAGSTALRDQERTCREYAERQNWIVLDEFVRSEQPGKPGLTLESRPKLNSLLRDGSLRPRPFDVLLIKDPERLSRDLKHLAVITNHLHDNGIEWQTVEPELNSNTPNVYPMFAIPGIVEENFRKNHGKKVLRGQEGRILQGLSAGSSYFGYRSVPVTDYGHGGRVLGHKLEVSESEAAIVRRVFYLSSSGLSCPDVAMNLTCEEVPAPGRFKSRPPRWNSKVVRRILQNPLYVGKVTWNKTSQAVHPITGKRLKRTNVPQRWVQFDAPALRIVSDQTWNRAQEFMRTTKGKLASQEVDRPQSEQATTSKSHEAGALQPEEAQSGAISTSDHRTHAGGHFLCAKDGKIPNGRICS